MLCLDIVWMVWGRMGKRERERRKWEGESGWCLWNERGDNR